MSKNYLVHDLISRRTVVLLTVILLTAILAGSFIFESYSVYGQRGGPRPHLIDPPIPIDPIAPAPKPPKQSDPEIPAPSSRTIPDESLNIISTKQKIDRFFGKVMPAMPSNVEPSTTLYKSNTFNFKALIDFVRPFQNFLVGLIGIGI